LRPLNVNVFCHPNTFALLHFLSLSAEKGIATKSKSAQKKLQNELTFKNAPFRSLKTSFGHVFLRRKRTQISAIRGSLNYVASGFEMCLKDAFWVAFRAICRIFLANIHIFPAI